MTIDLAKINFGPQGGGGGGGQKPETTFDVTPTTSSQSVTPSSGYVFSSGTVQGVTSAIDANIQEGNIREGVTILGVTGDYRGSGITPSGTVTLSANGTYDVTTYASASVSVPGIIPSGTVTISSNGTYDVTTYASASVSVPTGITPSGTIAITMNGIFDVTNYASASVSISGGATDYRYKNGTIPGLSDLGWDADSIGYAETNIPHYGWQDSEYTVSQANKDMYGVINADNKDSYLENTDMVYLPYFDTGSGDYDYSSFFANFYYIKAIPIFDWTGFSNSTDATGMFDSCYELITVPPIDTSNVVSMDYMFANCTKLTAVPPIDTSNVVSMGGMFRFCENLIGIPLLDTSSVEDMTEMFYYCLNIMEIPPLDTSSVTNMAAMFADCRILKNIPFLDTSNVEDMNAMFNGCYDLITIPALDTSNVTDMSYMFSNCYRLETLPVLDTSNVQNMDRMFSSCSVKEINGIDFSSLSSAPQYMFGTSPNEYLTHMIVNGKIDFDCSSAQEFIYYLKVLDYASVKSILQAMYRTTNNDPKTMAFDCKTVDPQGELAQLITDCGTKGWTVTGLTIYPNPVAVTYTTSDGRYASPNLRDRINPFGQGVEYLTTIYQNGQGTWYFDANPTKFGYNVFNYKNITSVDIPNTVTEISEGCFLGNNMTSVTIPASVEFIKQFAFWECHNLQYITVEAMTPPNLQVNPFWEDALQEIRVPAAALSDYQVSIWGSWYGQYLVGY